MEELFDTLTNLSDVTANTRSVAVERRTGSGLGLALTLLGAYLSIGSGAYLIVIGLAGRMPW